jgi:protease-4
MRLLFALLGSILRLLFFPALLFRRHKAAPKGSYIEVVVRGRVHEILPKPSLFAWRRRPEVSVFALRELVEEVLRDARVKGFVVRIDSMGGGMAAAESLRAVLATLREAQRDVVSYLPFGGDTKELYVAVAANRIIAGPQATLAPVGFAVATRYIRPVLDRSGVVADVLAHGKYKSAGEQLVRSSMSDEQREQTGAIVDAFYEAVVDGVAQGRKVDADRARAILDGAPYAAGEAVACGLADATAYDDELKARLGDPRTPIVGAAPYLKARRATRFAPLTPRGVIGVVRVHGPIVHQAADSSAGFSARMAADARINATIRRAREDRRVRGVILHIDSPGGSALASDRIHHEIVQLAAKKPVVACMGDAAASGGYYVAAPAHAIVAQPTTITGSIGVVAARLAFEPLLARVGVVREIIQRGARAGLLDWMHPLSDDERAALMREVDAFYAAFVRVVAEGRRRSLDEVERVAQGRVWTGRDAHTRGLVDDLGGFDAALRIIREKIGRGAEGLAPVLLPAPRRALASPTSAAAYEPLLRMMNALLGSDAPLLTMAVVPRQGVFAWCSVAASLTSFAGGEEIL